jgi:hypothetical protein
MCDTPASGIVKAGSKEGKHATVRSVLRLLLDTDEGADWDDSTDVATVLTAMLAHGHLSTELDATIRRARANAKAEWSIRLLSKFEPTSDELRKDPSLGPLITLAGTAVATES